MEDNNNKTPWTDVSKIWKKIAAVIAAVGVLSTFTVKVFNTPPEPTYLGFALLGLILLLISWYVDKQTYYTHNEILSYEHKAREDFVEAINKTIELTNKNRQDTEDRISRFEDRVSVIIANTEETRRDTLRIQLMMLMRDEENNVDTILKVAEAYFINLQGDWYMTNEFNKWAKEHDVMIPDSIWNSMKSHVDK